MAIKTLMEGIKIKYSVINFFVKFGYNTIQILEVNLANAPNRTVIFLLKFAITYCSCLRRFFLILSLFFNVLLQLFDGSCRHTRQNFAIR